MSMNLSDRADKFTPVSAPPDGREDHCHMVALHFMHYNFCRVHETLRCTPAMESGLSDHVRTIQELCALMPKPVMSESTIQRRLILMALGESDAHAEPISIVS